MRNIWVAGLVMLLAGILSAQAKHEWSFSGGLLFPWGDLGKHFDSAMLWDISYTGNSADPGRMVWAFKYLSKEWKYYDHDDEYGDTRGTTRISYYVFAPSYRYELCGRNNICPFFNIGPNVAYMYEYDKHEHYIANPGKWYPGAYHGSAITLGWQGGAGVKFKIQPAYAISLEYQYIQSLHVGDVETDAATPNDLQGSTIMVGFVLRY